MTFSDTPPELYGYRATYVYNYDGDTCTLSFDLGMSIVNANQDVRLFGINCPEMNKKETRNKAVLAQRHLMELLGSALEIRIVTMKNRNQADKKSFNRWIGMIWVKNDEGHWRCVNQAMIDDGHAVPFIP